MNALLLVVLNFLLKIRHELFETALARISVGVSPRESADLEKSERDSSEIHQTQAGSCLIHPRPSQMSGVHQTFKEDVCFW